MTFNSFPIPTKPGFEALLVEKAQDVATDANRAETARDDAQGVLPDRLRRDVPTLLADTALTYTEDQPGTVAEGDIIRTRAEGFSYEVAASDATDHHVTTAGGVKLKVLLGGFDNISATAFNIIPGMSDPAPAITSALRIVSVHGVELELAEGDYDLAGGQVIVDSSNLSLIGRANFVKSDGRGAIKIIPPAEGLSNISLRQFSVDMSLSPVTTFGAAAIEETTNNDIDGLTIDGVTVITNDLSAIFFGDSTTGVLRNVRVRRCKIECAGVANYGIAFRKKVIGLEVDYNTVTLSNVNSFNPIALYGDTSHFDVHHNKVFGGGHSAIACSPANNGSIRWNAIDNDLFTQIANEAGIEAEWKAGHAGVDTSHDIVIEHNRVTGDYAFGVMITRRDTGAAAPYNITVCRNYIRAGSNNISVIECGDGCEVYRNDIGDATGSAVQVTLAGDDLKIIRNSIRNAAARGIRILTAGNDLAVEPNDINGTGNFGIILETSIGKRARIDFNTLHNIGPTTFAVINGIRLQNVGEGWSLCGNTVDRSTTTCLSIDESCEDGGRVNSNGVFNPNFGSGISLHSDKAVCTANVALNIPSANKITDNGTGNVVANNVT